MIDRPTVIRALAVYLPVLAMAALWVWRRPPLGRRAGCLLSALWNLPVLLVLHLCGARLGWWTFQADGGLLLGMPVDLYLGWALLWGPIPALAFPRLQVALVALVALWVDALLMPAMAPVVQLGPNRTCTSTANKPPTRNVPTTPRLTIGQNDSRNRVTPMSMPPSNRITISATDATRSTVRIETSSDEETSEAIAAASRNGAAAGTERRSLTFVVRSATARSCTPPEPSPYRSLVFTFQ